MRNIKTIEQQARRKPSTKAVVEDERGFVHVYKALLRDVIDRNPSGLRLRIAKALGTHRSFLSQITNAQDPTPIPAKHVRALFELCHFSEAERVKFLAAYEKAHPKRARQLESAATVEASSARAGVLEIQLPELGDKRRQRELEALVSEFVNRLAAVLRDR